VADDAIRPDPEADTDDIDAIDDIDATADADDRPVGAEPVRARPPDNPEVPEADAWDQADEVAAGPRRGRVSSDPEVPEADAWEQAQEVPFDDEGAG
jgi:hypothetical protein